MSRGPELPRYRLRICFSKDGRLRFISHLDFIRAFERAARRSGLPLAYTEGYSPGPKIAYGWPLPVGVAGLGEYLDVELTRRIAPDEAVRRLGESAPEGLTIREARYLSPRGPSLMAELDTGVYLIRMPSAGIEAAQWKDVAGRLMGKDRLVATRFRGTPPGNGAKKKTVDIRPLLRGVAVKGVEEGEVMILAELELSERGTARPDEVAGFLWEEAGLPASERAPGESRPARPEGMVAVRVGLRRDGRPAGPR